MGDATERLLGRVSVLVPEFQTRLSEPAAAFPEEELRALAGCGALAAPLPREWGGLGLGVEAGSSGDLLRLLHHTGRANLALGRIFEGHVNALLLIQRFGAAAQMRAAARDVIERDAVFGVWNTGPAGQPVARLLPDGNYVFSGGKNFASGAGRIARAIVTAECDGEGWQMFVLPLDRVPYGVDYDSWHPLGMEASESFSVDFSGMEADASSLLGRPGDYYREPAFTAGAFRFATIQLGAAQALFDFTCCFIRETGQTQNPHQLYRLGQMAVLAESGKQWVERAGRWLDAERPCAECLKSRAHLMRVAASTIGTDVIRLVEASVGARGLQGARPFARMLRDLQMYLRQGGADAAVTAIGADACRERVPELLQPDSMQGVEAHA